MSLIAAILVAIIIVVRSYKLIDKRDVLLSDLIKALIPAVVAIVCLILRGTYFALPEGAMVSGEYLTYRGYLLLGFLFLMGYIIRAATYACVYFYRTRN